MPFSLSTVSSTECLLAMLTSPATSSAVIADSLLPAAAELGIELDQVQLRLQLLKRFVTDNSRHPQMVQRSARSNPGPGAQIIFRVACSRKCGYVDSQALERAHQLAANILRRFALDRVQTLERGAQHFDAGAAGFDFDGVVGFELQRHRKRTQRQPLNDQSSNHHDKRGEQDKIAIRKSGSCARVVGQ